MATLNFNLTKKGENKYLILAIVFDRSIKGDRLKKSLGYFIEDKDRQWDPDRCRVLKHKDMAVINKKILEVETIFNDYLEDLVKFHRVFNGDELLQLLNTGKDSRYNPAKYLTDCFTSFLRTNRLNLTLDVVKHYTILKEQIEAFETDLRRGKKIILPEVDRDFFTDFGEYLIEQQNNGNKTINRKLRRIGTIMDHAFNEGWIKTQLYKKRGTLKEMETSRSPLLLAEVKAFTNYRTTDLTRRMIADAFITSMYTGLRYSDISQLHDAHFFNQDGLDYINLSMKKTLDDLSIPVPSFLMDILNRYRGNGRLFNLHENAWTNRVLKLIAHELRLRRMVEIKFTQGNTVKEDMKMLCEVIHMHLGRYTYTYLLDKGGLQATYIQDNLGHSDFATTQGYLMGDVVNRLQQTVLVLNKVVGM